MTLKTGLREIVLLYFIWLQQPESVELLLLFQGFYFEESFDVAKFEYKNIFHKLLS